MLLTFHIPNWFTDPLIGSWFILQLPCKVNDVNARMMKRKGCGRQQLWLILTYYYVIYVEVLRKTMPNHSDQSPVWNMNYVPPRYKKCAKSYPVTSTGCAVQWPADYTLCRASTANTDTATQPQQFVFPHDELLAPNWNGAANGVLCDPVHILPRHSLLSKCHAVPQYTQKGNSTYAFTICVSHTTNII